VANTVDDTAEPPTRKVLLGFHREQDIFEAEGGEFELSFLIQQSKLCTRTGSKLIRSIRVTTNP
jgi:hypothetical protein